MVHLITIEVTNQTWWGLCGSVFPPSLFLSLPVNLAKVDVRADHRIRWKNINHGHTQYSWVCYPSSWPSTIDHCWREKNKGTWSYQPRPKRPVVKKPGEQSYSTTEEGSDDYIFLWQVIIENVFVKLAWEEVAGPCTFAEPSRTAFPTGVRTEKIYL